MAKSSSKSSGEGVSISTVILIILISFAFIGGIGYLFYSSTKEDDTKNKDKTEKVIITDTNGKNNENGNNTTNTTTNTTNSIPQPTVNKETSMIPEVSLNMDTVLEKFAKKVNTKLSSEREIKTKRFDTLGSALKWCDETLSCSGIAFSKDTDTTKNALYEIHGYKKITSFFDPQVLSYRKKTIEDLSSNFEKKEDYTLNTTGKGAYEQSFDSLNEALYACMMDNYCLGVTQEDPSENKFSMQSYVTSATKKDSNPEVKWATGWEEKSGAVTYTKTALNQLNVTDKFEDRGFRVVENYGGSKNFAGVYPNVEDAMRACYSSSTPCWGFVRELSSSPNNGHVFSIDSGDGIIGWKGPPNDKNWKFYKRIDYTPKNYNPWPDNGPEP